MFIRVVRRPSLSFIHVNARLVLQVVIHEAFYINKTSFIYRAALVAGV